MSTYVNSVLIKYSVAPQHKALLYSSVSEPTRLFYLNMSHRSVFKSTSSVPPSKSARELRVEKFDAIRPAVISALQASKNVDHPSLEIAPVSGPNAAESDEIFLSNLESLPASAPV